MSGCLDMVTLSSHKPTQNILLVITVYIYNTHTHTHTHTYTHTHTHIYIYIYIYISYYILFVSYFVLHSHIDIWWDRTCPSFRLTNWHNQANTKYTSLICTPTLKRCSRSKHGNVVAYRHNFIKQFFKLYWHIYVQSPPEWFHGNK